MSQIFDELQEVAKRNYNKDILELFFEFGNANDLLILEELAYKTQLVIKKSEPNYNHGLLIFAALVRAVSSTEGDATWTCMDIGTARGFSALVTSLALNKYERTGVILSIDTIPHDEVRKWNCVLDGKNGISRRQIVESFHFGKDIVYLNGQSKFILRKLHVNRVNFAFIDGDHRWKSLKHEIEFLEQRQTKNDILLFDDYTPRYFPDVVKAVEKLASKYKVETFGSTERGYALLTRL